VAIARALVNEPDLLLADEPTGNLDARSALEIMTILRDLNRAGRTIVLVTHDAAMAEHAQRVVHIEEGVAQ
jgi:ABC-type lipoprotein export system ATPase subunit